HSQMATALHNPLVDDIPCKSMTVTGVLFAQARASTAARLFPIVFFICYLNFTVLLFVFGPWDWPVHNGTKLYIFLALAHLALFAGYYTAAFRQPFGYSHRYPLYKLVRWTVIVNLLLLFPTSAFRTGSAFPDVGHALADPGAAYSGSLALRDASTPTIEYI